MREIRVIGLVLFIAAGVLLSGCRTTADEVATSAQAEPVPTGGEPPAADQGGLTCRNIHDVTLRVALGNNQVKVTPNRVFMAEVDCVRWSVSADSGTARIAYIRFFNTDQDAKPHGKPKSDFALNKRDFCGGTTRCTVRFSPVPNGTLRYMARVTHEATGKESDPEVVIYCNGCNIPPFLNSLASESEEVAVALAGPQRIAGGGGGGDPQEDTSCAQVRFRVARGNDKVVVMDPRVRIPMGGCVDFTVTADAGTPGIENLNFFNSDAEAKPHGKRKSDFELRDNILCENAGTQCRVRFPGRTGTLRYMANIRHEGRRKKSDPEIVIYCDGCNILEW